MLNLIQIIKINRKDIFTNQLMYQVAHNGTVIKVLPYNEAVEYVIKNYPEESLFQVIESNGINATYPIKQLKEIYGMVC